MNELTNSPTIHTTYITKLHIAKYCRLQSVRILCDWQWLHIMTKYLTRIRKDFCVVQRVSKGYWNSENEYCMNRKFDVKFNLTVRYLHTPCHVLYFHQIVTHHTFKVQLRLFCQNFIPKYLWGHIVAKRRAKLIYFMHNLKQCVSINVWLTRYLAHCIASKIYCIVK